MNRQLITFLPLILILSLCMLLLSGLQQDPKKIASALIGKPIPEFHQANLLATQKILNNTNLPKQPFLLNVWGSWCEYCKTEHPFLMELTAQGIPIVGLNYRDKSQSALEFLHQLGNPFVFVIEDSKGTLAMQLGVDGAPETYLVDPQGVIRYRHSGALNKSEWQKVFLPELNKLNLIQ